MKSKNESTNVNFKRYHVVASSFIFMSLLIILFSNDNPSIVAAIYAFIIPMIISGNEKGKFKKGLYTLFL